MILFFSIIIVLSIQVSILKYEANYFGRWNLWTNPSSSSSKTRIITYYNLEKTKYNMRKFGRRNRSLASVSVSFLELRHFIKTRRGQLINAESLLSKPPRCQTGIPFLAFQLEI
jgi:hypothetical protein